MEKELLNALARVETLDGSTAILGNPVDTVRTNKDDQLVVLRALNHSVNDANILVLIGNIKSLFVKQTLQALP